MTLDFGKEILRREVRRRGMWRLMGRTVLRRIVVFQILKTLHPLVELERKKGRPEKLISGTLETEMMTLHLTLPPPHALYLPILSPLPTPHKPRPLCQCLTPGM